MPESALDAFEATALFLFVCRDAVTTLVLREVKLHEVVVAFLTAALKEPPEEGARGSRPRVGDGRRSQDGGTVDRPKPTLSILAVLR